MCHRQRHMSYINSYCHRHFPELEWQLDNNSIDEALISYFRSQFDKKKRSKVLSRHICCWSSSIVSQKQCRSLMLGGTQATMTRIRAHTLVDTQLGIMEQLSQLQNLFSIQRSDKLNMIHVILHTRSSELSGTFKLNSLNGAKTLGPLQCRSRLTWFVKPTVTWWFFIDFVDHPCQDKRGQGQEVFNFHRETFQEKPCKHWLLICCWLLEHLTACNRRAAIKTIRELQLWLLLTDPLVRPL